MLINTMSAIPDNYTMPVSNGGRFTKFEDGTSTDLRIIDSIVTGWQYFNFDNKPVRSRHKWDKTPNDIGESKYGAQPPKHIWVLTVFNHNTQQVEICTLSQVSIQRALLALELNPKWGSLLEYDITITKTKVSDKTEYAVTPNPKAELTEAVCQLIQDTGSINLDAYFASENPFAE